MRTDVEQFLLWEQSTRDTIDFKKIYVDIAGDVLAGLVLSEIVYWHLPSKSGNTRLQVRHKDTNWIAVRRYEWWDRTRLTPRQADRALGILEQAGVITKDVFKFNGDPTTHVALIWERFLPALNTHLSTPTVNPFLPIGENEIDESVITESRIRDNVIPDSLIPVTETTTETTSKTTTETKEKEAPSVQNVPAASNGLVEVLPGFFLPKEMPTDPEVRGQFYDAAVKAVAEKVAGVQVRGPYTDAELADQFARAMAKHGKKTS